jgi:NADH-quinone oxidoreductase subunit N
VRGAKGNDIFTSFEGLAKKNPVEAFCLTISMLSLTGIPPLAGFMAKYYLFATSIDKGYLWLVIIAILGSAVSAAYYFKPIIAMYLKEGDGVKLESSLTYRSNIIFLTILTLLLGLVPFLFTGLL